MKNELIWNIKVDGVRHEVYLTDRGNSFDVFVDGEFRFNVRSDINLDIEEDLTVGTKRCRIAIYRGVPDLIVDGILLNADAEIVRKERSEKRLTIAAGILLMVLGLFAMWMYMAMRVSGQDFYFGAFGPIFAILVSAAGVVLTLYGLRKKAG